MASDKQIQANRLNAKKSTGPQSPEGKKRVAHNRTKHGLAGEHVVLANEDPSAFDNLLAILNGDWDPQSETEAFLVETLAYNQWRLLRIGRMEHASLSRKLQSQGQPSLSMEVEDLSRYEGRSRRAYNGALNMLMKLQAARPKKEEEQQQQQLSEANTPPQPARIASEDPPSNLPITVIGRSNPIPPGESPGRLLIPDAA